MCFQSCEIEDIPTIKVVKMDGKWFTLDNRRLWVFRRLEKRGWCRKIPVIIVNDIPNGRFTTINGGQDIKVRGYPGYRDRDDEDSSDSDKSSSDSDDHCIDSSSDSDDDCIESLDGLKLE